MIMIIIVKVIMLMKCHGLISWYKISEQNRALLKFYAVKYS